mgnify:CR=1 FL=1
MMWKWRIRNTTSTCHISADGPVGMICLPDIGSVMEWMQRNGESIHFALLLKMPGNADGLVDREV